MKNIFLSSLEKSNPFFKKSIDMAFLNKKISHAFLLSSDVNVNSREAAYYLVLKIIEFYTNKFYDIEYLKNGYYLDFKEIKPQNNTIKKEQVLNVLQLFSKSSFKKNNPKILFISNIEKGNSYSLNVLLKYIENPPQNTFIIMSTNNFKKVLSTIISRSQIYEIRKKNLKIFEEELKNNHIKPSVIKFYAKIFDDITAALEHNKKLFLDLVENTLNAFQKALVNKYAIIEFLEENLKIDNYYFLIQIFRFFFQDIFMSVKEKNLTFISAKEIIKKYQLKSRNFYHINFIIEQFILKLKSNTNFKIQKQFFLIKLMELYGN